MTWTFVKRAGAPAGSIRITMSSGSYTIDDTTNTTITTTDAQAAGDLQNHPYLTLQGISGTASTPPVISSPVLANGILQKPGPGGALTNFDGSELPKRTGVIYAASPPYNVKGDVKTLNDAVITAGGSVTSASYSFTQNDVGKLAVAVLAGTGGNTHVYTTIATVTNGAATLANTAIPTPIAANGEFVFATDNTAALQQAVTDATTNGWTVELPTAQEGFGLNGVITSSSTVAIRGQEVVQLYGGTSSHNDANFPTISPYFQGSVLVQFAAGTNILNLSARGRSQTVRRLGLRFAGRFSNTGHGIYNVPPSNLGNIGGIFEDVSVFGHDGDHYGFVVESPELSPWRSCRSYGGGGFWLRTSATTPGPPGNLTSIDCYSATFVNGVGHGLLIDSSAGAFFDALVFSNFESGIRIPNPTIPGITPPAGTTQKCLQTLITGTAHSSTTTFVQPGFESDTGSNVVFPTGVGCNRTNDPNGITVGNAAMTTTPATGASFRNLTGTDKTMSIAFLLKPAATAVATTTLAAQANAGATTITVSSATGVAAGQSVELVDSDGAIEFGVVASIAGSVVTLVAQSGFGLTNTHLNGITVRFGGAAVVIGQNSVSGSFPGTLKPIWLGLPTGGGLVQHQVRLPIPCSWYGRLDYPNSRLMWAEFI